MIFFDLTARLTYKNVPNWHRDFVRVAPDVPVVLVGNKVDVKDRVVKAKSIIFHRKKNMQYFELSAKSNFNIEKPFLYLIRRLARDDSVVLVEAYAPLPPPEVHVDPVAFAEREEEIIKALSCPLPDDDEDL